MNSSVGFLGVGKYSGRLARAIVTRSESSGPVSSVHIYDKSNINGYISDASMVNIENSSYEVVEKSNIIFVGVPIQGTGRSNFFEELSKSLAHANGDKILVFMDNFRIPKGLKEHVRGILRIMFNLSIYQVADTYISCLWEYGRGECIDTINRTLKGAGNILELDDMGEYIKSRFVFGSGLAVCADLKERAIDYNEVEHFVEGILSCNRPESKNTADNFPPIHKIIEILNDGVRGLENDGLAIAEIQELVQTHRGATETFYSMWDGDLATLKESAQKALRHYTDRIFNDHIFHLSDYTEHLLSDYSVRRNPSLAIELFSEQLNDFARQWPTYIRWFNIVEYGTNREVHYVPQKQEDGHESDVIDNWVNYPDQYASEIHGMPSIQRYADVIAKPTIMVFGEDQTNVEFLSSSADLVHVQDCTGPLSEFVFSKVESFSEENNFFDFVSNVDIGQSILDELNESMLPGVNLEREKSQMYLKYLLWIGCAYRDEFKYFIYVPSAYYESIPYAFIIGLKRWPGDQFILSLRHVVFSLFIPIIEEKNKSATLRSAIATIMGRNMSHNIGSHVIWHITQQTD